ncbi:MAG: hypothetical protein AAFU55_17830, partial [Pseudomonadota bacterium]
LFLEGVEFTTDQLINYGFDAPAQGSAGFVDNPYGFNNTSSTTADPAITPDGAFVAFVDKQNLDDLEGDVTPVPTGPDGPTNEDDATMDVFVRNMETGAIQRASVGPNGEALTTDGLPLNEGETNSATSLSPALSTDGRYVAFASNGRASPLDGKSSGDVYIRDLLIDGP